jgi:hypothetical protein
MTNWVVILFNKLAFTPFSFPRACMYNGSASELNVINPIAVNEAFKSLLTYALISWFWNFPSSLSFQTCLLDKITGQLVS